MIISTFKDNLESILHGTTNSHVQNLNTLINRAARTVLLDIDPQETKRYEQIANALYDEVYLYAIPSDLKGNRIIDIRPQVGRTPSDNFSLTSNEYFDLHLDNNTLTTEDRKATKYLRIAKSLNNRVTVSECSSITDDGTWSAGGDATNVTTDTENYVSGNGSLNFDLTGSATTGYLENSTMTAVDLSDHEDKSALFLYVYIPDTSIITSFTLYWGSNSTNYWYKSVTSAHPSDSFVVGWNLLRFDWNGATKTGSPSASAVDYIKFLVTSTGSTAETDLRLDNIVSILGNIYYCLYYSKYLFRSSAGTWAEEVSTDDDYINLDTESFNLLLFKTAEYAAQQIQGRDGAQDIQYFRDEYEKAKRQYNLKYPSEAMKARKPYYRL